MKKKYSSFKQVLAGLRKLRRKGWKARNNDNLLELRRPGGRKFCFCPLTALVFDNSGRAIPRNSADIESIIENNFDEVVATKVINLADWSRTGFWSSNMAPETIDKARRQLANACGIVKKT